MIAVNQFPGGGVHPTDTVRDALAVPTGAPVVMMDAREPDSCLATLVALVEHALQRVTSNA